MQLLHVLLTDAVSLSAAAAIACAGDCAAAAAITVSFSKLRAPALSNTATVDDALEAGGRPVPLLAASDDALV